MSVSRLKNPLLCCFPPCLSLISLPCGYLHNLPLLAQPTGWGEKKEGRKGGRWEKREDEEGRASERWRWTVEAGGRWGVGAGGVSGHSPGTCKDPLRPIYGTASTLAAWDSTTAARLGSKIKSDRGKKLKFNPFYKGLKNNGHQH